MKCSWLVGALACSLVLSGCADDGKEDPPGNPPPEEPPPGERDVDGDGVKAALDCDDADPNVYPGAPELCDGKANGCGAAMTEDGTAAFFQTTGKGSDITAQVQGTAAAPVVYDASSNAGTLRFCTGTFFVSVRSAAASLVVRGAGQAQTELSGGDATRLVTLSADRATLEVADLTLRDGKSMTGGAIAGLGLDQTLKLSKVTVTGSVADGAAPEGWGGAVWWSGTATISDSTFTGNTATTAGGAVGVQGALTVRTSSFANNGSTGAGGAVAVISGTATLDTVEARDNGASQNGGGLFLQDVVSTLTKVRLINNNAQFGGGAALTGGKLTMDESTLDDNFAAGGGAGLSLGKTEALVKRSLFTKNESVRFNNARPLPLSGFGGALNILGSKVRIEGGTIAQNQSQWGWGLFVQYNADKPTAVDVVGTTFTDNRNISGNGSSGPVEHWSATRMQTTPVTGTATFHCDDIGCALMPST